MRYKNKRTGVTINVTSEIYGGDWIIVDEETKKEVEIVEDDQNVENQKSVEQEAEEFVEEEINLEEMSKKELIEFAKEHKIEINERDNKPTIIGTIAKAFE